MSKIRLHGSSSGYTEIAPVAASGNNTLTLPNDGTIISKDSAGAVGVTSVVTDTIKVGAAVTIGESGVNVVGVVTATSGIVGLTSTGMPAGSIIQVKQTHKTDIFSSSGTTFTDITGLTVSITPTSSSNKILVSSSICFGAAGNGYLAVRLFRNSTALAQSTTATGNQINCTFGVPVPYDAAGEYKLHTVSYQFLDDAQDTNVHTYKYQMANFVVGTSNFYVNRPHNDTNYSYIHRGTSTITAMEVAT